MKRGEITLPARGLESAKDNPNSQVASSKEVPNSESQSAPGRCLNAVGKLQLGGWDFFGIWGLVLGACEIPRCPALPHLLRPSTMQYPEGGEMDLHSDAFLRRLMRRQLRLAIACAVTFLIALLGLPLLNYFYPEAMATRVFGFTLTWFILGVLFFPFVWIISYVFIKRSIFLEEEEEASAASEATQESGKVGG